MEERRHQADMVQTYKILTGKDMVNSETWFTSITESGRPTRSAADPHQPQSTNIQAGNQKTIFLPKSAKELEQDPSKLKRMLSVSKMATELSVTQWWKDPT